MQARCTGLNYKIIPRSFTYVSEKEEAKLRLVPQVRRSRDDIISKLDGKDKIIRLLKDRTTLVRGPGCGVLWFLNFFFKQNKLGSKSSCK